MVTFLIICVILIVVFALIVLGMYIAKSKKDKEIEAYAKEQGISIDMARILYGLPVGIKSKTSIYEELHIPKNTPEYVCKLIKRASEWDRYREDVGTIFYMRDEAGNPYEKFSGEEKDEEGRPFIEFSNGYVTIKVKKWEDGRYSTLKNHVFKDQPYLYASIDELTTAGFKICKN